MRCVERAGSTNPWALPFVGIRVRRVASVVLFAVGAVLPLWPTLAASAPGQVDTVLIPRERVDTAITGLDGLASAIMEKTGIPGLAIAVVHEGATVFARGYGVRELGKPAAVDAETVFQVASLSKSLAGTVVARQVGEGIVAWDTRVKTYLPWFELQDDWVADHVTIGDLFSHRSGLPDHAGDDLEDLGFGRREILERLRSVPLDGFRDTYAYTNFGLTAAAEAVAGAAGTDWAALCERALYSPLGMVATSSRFDDFAAKDNRAVGHTIVGGKFAPLRVRMPDAQSPAGGVSSTVGDLARWMILVLSEGRFGGEVIVDREALLAAVTPQMISRPSSTAEALPGFYGYGFGVGIQPTGRTTISHSGAFVLGAATNYVMLPAEKLGIVVLSNAAPVGAVEALTAQFMDLVQYGSVQRDWLALFGTLFEDMTAPAGKLVGVDLPAKPVPPAALLAYEGIYENDYFGPARLTIQDERLSLTLGPQGQTFGLRHFAGNQFYFPVFNESMPEGSLSSISFKLDESGEAGAFVVEFLNEYGLGRFVRRSN